MGVIEDDVAFNMVARRERRETSADPHSAQTLSGLRLFARSEVPFKVFEARPDRV